MSRKIVVAISGWKGSGKDTVANIVMTKLAQNNIKNLSFSKYSFAMPIKEVAHSVFGVYENTKTKEDLIPEMKEFFNKKISYRKLIIKIGEGMKTLFGSNIWINSINKSMHDEMSSLPENSDHLVIFSDVRYADEIKYLEKLKEEGFEVYYICIFRKESLPKFVVDGFYPYNKNDMEVIKKKYHADRSEYEWCKCNPKFFAVIKNDGTIQDLENQIEEKLISKIFA